MIKLSKTTSTCVIGFGSIEKRHAEILQSLGPVFVVSSRHNLHYPTFHNLEEIFSKINLDYIVVSNETYKHHETLVELNCSDYSGPVLVEKPLFASPIKEQLSISKKTKCGYNLRYMGYVQFLKIYLEQDLDACDINNVEVKSKSYLPNWRGDRNFKENYSASLEFGGGVLRDLSHDLDLIRYILGPYRICSSWGGNLGVLGINADEYWAIDAIVFKDVPLNIELSFALDLCNVRYQLIRVKGCLSLI